MKNYLDKAVVIRDETHDGLNSAYRIGTLFIDVIRRLGMAITADDISVESTSAGVSLVFSVLDENGDNDVVRVALPVITPSQFESFRNSIQELVTNEQKKRLSADEALKKDIMSVSDMAKAAIPENSKGVAGGVAPLDEDNKIPVEHLPDIDLGLELGFSVGQAFPGEVGKALQSAVEGQQSKLDLLYDREFPITASLRVDDITSEAETINSGKVYSRDSTIALLGVYSSLKQAGIEIEEGEITDLTIIQKDGAGQTIREKEFLDISEGKSFEEWENVGVPAGSNAQGALKTIATFNMANGKYYSANHTMYFACPVYFAVVGKDFEVSQENIVNLVAQSTTQKFLQATKGKTVTFSQNDEKNCYIVPKDYGALTSISDGQDNFLNTSYKLTEGIILTVADGSEHEYRVYMMKDASSVSNYKLTFQ